MRVLINWEPLFDMDVIIVDGFVVKFFFLGTSVMGKLVGLLGKPTAAAP